VFQRALECFEILCEDIKIAEGLSGNPKEPAMQVVCKQSGLRLSTFNTQVTQLQVNDEQPSRYLFSNFRGYACILCC